jgi:hypothetical protein
MTAGDPAAAKLGANTCGRSGRQGGSARLGRDLSKVHQPAPCSCTTAGLPHLQHGRGAAGIYRLALRACREQGLVRPRHRAPTHARVSVYNRERHGVLIAGNHDQLRQLVVRCQIMGERVARVAAWEGLCGAVTGEGIGVSVVLQLEEGASTCCARARASLSLRHGALRIGARLQPTRGARPQGKRVPQVPAAWRCDCLVGEAAECAPPHVRLRPATKLDQLNASLGATAHACARMPVCVCGVESRVGM